ncbi:MAG: carbohydrate kinase family protein [Armatimonadota bacterium]|nr:carbohydrate kinase family protein [Armatimonadota bacterium]
MENLRQTLIRVADGIRNHRITKAALEATWPGLATLLCGDQIEQKIDEFIAKHEDQHEEILGLLRKVLENANHDSPGDYVIAIGSSNIEYVLWVDKVEVGLKHSIREAAEYVGGSGLNYVSRMLSCGMRAYPVLSTGEDERGEKIRQHILDIAQGRGDSHNVITFLDPSNFFAPKMKTPGTTIVVDGTRRTIFSQQPGGMDEFANFAKARLKAIKTLEEKDPGAVMIGHLYCDYEDEATGKIGGECTKYLISRYKDDALVFTNFGGTQFKLGSDFWAEDIANVGVFQLSLDEARAFFSGNGVSKSLVDMIEWFRERNVTAVVTLDKFGAVATYKGDDEDLIIAWPFDIENIVDTTGAGDAFGAGLVSQLIGKPDFQWGDLCEAVRKAREWAAYACTTPGGCANCPDKQALTMFNKILNTQARIAPVQKVALEAALPILRLFDRAYPPI